MKRQRSFNQGLCLSDALLIKQIQSNSYPEIYVSALTPQMLIVPGLSPTKCLFLLKNEYLSIALGFNERGEWLPKFTRIYALKIKSIVVVLSCLYRTGSLHKPLASNKLGLLSRTGWLASVWQISKHSVCSCLTGLMQIHMYVRVVIAGSVETVV